MAELTKECIIIIGNGFDLAHQLKTGYEDFSNWLINNIAERVIECLDKLEDDEIIEENFFKDYKRQLESEIFGDEYDDFSRMKRFIVTRELENAKQALLNDESKIGKFLNNKLLVRLYRNKDFEWFNVEQIYFNQLYTFSKEPSKDLRNRNIDQLNKEFDYIKQKLKEYLRLIKPFKNNEIQNALYNLFINYDKKFIIDFNYTKTIEYYFNNSSYYNTEKVIKIHGSLKDDNIIFGYGNDLDQKYQDLKLLEENNVLENMKTVEYLMDNNYQEFIDYLNSMNSYDLYVIGHSLGLTDKTLLREILDNKKCKQINLFKRGDLKDNPEKQRKHFKELVMAITRIMNSEADVRNKVVDYKVAKSFPQITSRKQSLKPTL